MGEGEAFLAGGVTGGVLVGPLAYQAGYNKGQQDLQPYIAQLQYQNRVKDQLLADQDKRIAELEAKSVKDPMTLRKAIARVLGRKVSSISGAE